MAGYLRYLQGLCLGGVLGVIVVPALAQMSDPTRPAVNESATNAANENAAAPTAGLQTIIRRKAGKPAAIINGEYVELGGRVGESRLTEIGESSVVLSGPSGKETMALTPGIEKKPITQKQNNNATGKSAKKVRKHMRN
jgi:MSHA biogenesis protein MshK